MLHKAKVGEPEDVFWSAVLRPRPVNLCRTVVTNISCVSVTRFGYGGELLYGDFEGMVAFRTCCRAGV